MSGGRFDRCMAIVFGEEGGYSNNPNDRGGPTNLGLTEGTIAGAIKAGVLAPGVTVRSIARDQAERVYFELYWKASRAPELPAPLDLCLFDAYVNHRPKVAVRLLQAALKIDQDGMVGPLTIAAAKAQELRGVVARYAYWRRNLYHRIVDENESQAVFLKGWLNRVDSIEKSALAEVA